MPFPGISGAVSVSAGPRYNCALLASGTIACWGDDGEGQLGNGSTEDTPTPVKVSGIKNAVQASTGGFHACAVLATHVVVCWGRNLRGSLGNGTRAGSSVPVQVSGISSAVSVSAAYGHDETCALLAGGSIKCWGPNEYGQLGNGTTVDSPTPVTVSGITNAVSVSAGGEHVCAVLASGAVYCWGRNDLGQLGTGTRTGSTTPVPTAGVSGAATISSSPRGYSCTALRSGSVFCWGLNLKDQLGNGLWPRPSLKPVRAVGITNAVAVTTSLGHACALLSSGAADCWGYDDYGQLGKGGGSPNVTMPVPVLYPGLPRAASASAAETGAPLEPVAPGEEPAADETAPAEAPPAEAPPAEAPPAEAKAAEAKAAPAKPGQAKPVR